MPLFGSQAAYFCAIYGVVQPEGLSNMNVNLQYNSKDPEWVQIASSKPTEEELLLLIQKSGLFRLGGATKLTVQLLNGKLSISSLWGGPEIGFPNNCNSYKLPHTKHIENITAEWICKEWEHLCWTDFHYRPPQEYDGDDPQTLDELCCYFRNLRQKPRVSRAEKERTLKLFLNLIFEETTLYAEKLNMPFHSLHLQALGSINVRAKTDGCGTITYNVHKLFYDADSIRHTLVHELCHSAVKGHGKEFSKVMEESMLALEFIPRPCSYSARLYESMRSGARFPIGIYCPGYQWFTGLKGEFDNRFLPKTSLYKSYDSNKPQLLLYW